MRLIYCDEAGISNPEQEPFLVVAGLIVHADHLLTAIERHLDRLVERRIPEEHRADFIFHAHELFNGGGKVFKRDQWPLDRRLEIANDLAKTVKRFKLPLALGHVERAEFLNRYPSVREIAVDVQVMQHVTAYLHCALTVEHWMRLNTQSEVCMLIVEDNDRARRSIRDFQRHHQDPRNIDLIEERARKHFPLRKIKEDPLFQPKRRSSILQLSDFVAYVVKRALMVMKKHEKSEKITEHDKNFWEVYQVFCGQTILFDETYLKQPPGRLSRSVRRSDRRPNSARPR